jgi:hypothetical protein
MWGITEYKKTGTWPSIDLAYYQSEKKLKEFAQTQIEALTSAEQTTVTESIKSIETSNKFIPSSDSVSDLLIKLYENLFR